MIASNEIENRPQHARTTCRERAYNNAATATAMKPNSPALEADTTGAAPREEVGSVPDPVVVGTTPPVPVPMGVVVELTAMAVGWMKVEVVFAAMEEEDEVRVRVLTWETWMVRVMVEVEVVVATVVSCARARRGRRMARKRLMSCILIAGWV